MSYDNSEEAVSGEGSQKRKPRASMGQPFESVMMSEKWDQLDRTLEESEAEAQREAQEDARLAAQRMERLKIEVPAGDIVEALFSAGVDRLWETRQAFTSATRERDAADEQREYEIDRAELGEVDARELERRREAVVNGMHWRAQPPLWQQISGLIPEREAGLHPGQRAAGIRRLIQKVERMIRFELRSAENSKFQNSNSKENDKRQNSKWDGGTDERGERESGDNPSPYPLPQGEGKQQQQQQQQAGGTPAVRVDATRRTAQWDPLQTICSYLSIAPRKLSALSREVNGLAITQLADAIKAELLREKMAKRLMQWMAGIGELAQKAGADLQDRAFAVWKMLRAERQKKGAHRSSAAFALGFSSYTRMFRACLVCYGLAPQEIELELIAEGLNETTPCVPVQAAAMEEQTSRTDLPQRHEDTKGHEEREGEVESELTPRQK